MFITVRFVNESVWLCLAKLTCYELTVAERSMGSRSRLVSTILVSGGSRPVSKCSLGFSTTCQLLFLPPRVTGTVENEILELVFVRFAAWQECRHGAAFDDG